jgi:hypothetical protein
MGDKTSFMAAGVLASDALAKAAFETATLSDPDVWHLIAHYGRSVIVNRVGLLYLMMAVLVW